MRENAVDIVSTEKVKAKVEQMNSSRWRLVGPATSVGDLVILTWERETRA